MQKSWIRRAAGRIRRHWQQRGALVTVRFLLSRVFRHEIHVVYEICDKPRTAVRWEADEQLLQFGPENLDSALTPELRAFLGGDEAVESLEGVRAGDRLFLITSGNEYVHRGYIMFKTRQSKVLGDNDAAPIIGYCSTVPRARGRGLYRRALEAEVSYLQNRGYRRVLIETDPENYASLKGIEAAGFTFAWEASVWILLNLFVVRRIRDASGSHWRAFLLL